MLVIFVNPIMQKVAALIISEEPQQQWTPQSILGKQNREVMRRLVHQYQNNTCEVTAEVLECTQIEFLSKQVQTIVTGRQNDAQPMKFSESVVIQYCKQHSLGRRGLCGWLVHKTSRNPISPTGLDLPLNESTFSKERNLIQWKPEINFLLFHQKNDGTYHGTCIL